MTHTTLKLVTAAVIVATTALISGCSNKAQDIDLTLIGGDGQDIENRYTVDIRYDTDEAPINSDTAIVISTAEPEEISEPDIPKEETTAPGNHTGYNQGNTAGCHHNDRQAAGNYTCPDGTHRSSEGHSRTAVYNRSHHYHKACKAD